LEIGPGPGALTAALLKSGAFVYAVELDTVFAKELNRFQNSRLRVFEADILQFPMKHLPKDIKIIANLPYHITTPILERIFAHPFSSITIMVQKEVADRMSAQAGTKVFGSLSVFVQFHSNIHSSFTVPAHSFYPQPKIDSTVIRLDFRKPPDVDPVHFFSLVHKAFQQRRKMLTSTLDLPKEKVREALISIGIRPDARPENLSLGKWVELSQLLL
jgi:16S rRNA (adenine1518-N6/adenine1519-N6)-dimethyltransferase